MLNILIRNLSRNPSTRWLFSEIKLGGSKSTRNAKRVAKTSSKPAATKSKQTDVRQFSLTGLIEPGRETPYAVDGQDFEFDNDTWIFGDITLGISAVVQGVFKPGNVRYARKIVLKKPNDE